MTAVRRVVAGFHAVNARLRAAPGSVSCLYADAQRRDPRMQQVLARAAAAGVRIVEVTAERLAGMTQGLAHQGVVAHVEADQRVLTLDDVLAQVDPGFLVLLLDGVTDPRNLGACIRTAQAAGAGAVIVPRDRSAALTPAASRAAAGAAETLPLLAVTNLARTIEALQDAGVWVIGAAADAPRNLFDVDLVRPLAWVLGAEGQGLRRLTRERCDELAKIPLAGGVDSLNVSVATGVCLFEAVRQRLARERVAPESPGGPG
jgi:23S rRNA (guanosine2251-2'-O)-methyltransferase